MKLHTLLVMAMFLAPSLKATTILDATVQNTALLHTGDTLAFEIFGGSFGINAKAFGLPRYPTDVSFAFVSLPMSWTGTFSGSLSSADGVYSIAFGGPLSFGAGSFSGAAYQGPVSNLQGFLHLTPLLSQEIFGGGPAVLSLRNNGPDLTVGIAPYTLRQDLFVSLAGGPLSVGAIGGSVNLQSAGNLAPQESPAIVPEPDSSGLLLIGGGLLCGLSVLLTRFAGRKIRKVTRKINRLQSSNPL